MVGQSILCQIFVHQYSYPDRSMADCIQDTQHLELAGERLGPASLLGLTLALPALWPPSDLRHFPLPWSSTVMIGIANYCTAWVSTYDVRVE